MHTSTAHLYASSASLKMSPKTPTPSPSQKKQKKSTESNEFQIKRSLHQWIDKTHRFQHPPSPSGMSQPIVEDVDEECENINTKKPSVSVSQNGGINGNGNANGNNNLKENERRENGVLSKNVNGVLPNGNRQPSQSSRADR